MNKVKAWEEEVIIPTYEIGEEEKNPVFLEKRVYQGSSGVVYPYPVIEKIYDEKKDKAWKAVFLENDYLKIMILPQLGGRVQMAFDKVKNRHFVYYNQVIKPALVGLTGPWISGGIEFNWPQHHRPSTYLGVDYLVEENADGSKTVWCSEIERMSRTKGMAGFTLYPDKAYMEIKVKLYNRTPHPQTFLWWANPAVKVNDHYQSVFPPDVNAVFDHGKRDVSTFPIATGTYYKVDYSAGVDISRYKNIPVPTSYMAIKSDYDFIGGYEHDTRGGMLHVANHHISPGKKQWTWGNGDFGYAWDRNLTDEDGPYIELMCGVYTDNQPDFSWIMPYEEKAFSQYFMPYHHIGAVKNATKEAMVNLEYDGEFIKMGVYTTSAHNNAKIILKHAGKILYETKANLTPLEAFIEEYLTATTINREDLSIEVQQENGKQLIAWKTRKELEKEVPEPAKAARNPGDIEHNEQLYLTGLHLEQYRHATFKPEDYYMEALRRDQGDARCNNAMGQLEMRKANFDTAQGYFEKAIRTMSERNPNPYDGEAFFNLGLVSRFQGHDEEACKAFYKAVWNDAWQGAGYLQLAQLATKKEEYETALELVEKSLQRQWHNHKARHLKTILLRKTAPDEKALKFINDSLEIDVFNFGLYFEKYLMLHNKQDIEQLHRLTRRNIHNYMEISLDYAWAGCFEEAIILLTSGIEQQKVPIYPMAWYFLGWFYHLNGHTSKSVECCHKAEEATPGTCFPNRLEEVLAMRYCMGPCPDLSKTPYYLGNFLYHKKEYKTAISHWEKSVELNPSFPTVHRNLALAYFNKAGKPAEALQELEKAFELDKSDARVLMELDALYKRIGKNYEFRLQNLEKYPDLVDFRDDLYLEKISLLNFLGDHEKAYRLLMQRKFHPWEGGEGKVTGQYVGCLIEMAKHDITTDNPRAAIEKLEKAKTYPRNLGEGKLFGAQENDIHYWLGHCYNTLGDLSMSKEFYALASTGKNELSAAMFYNDQQPDKIFYQGLALMKLGNSEEAGLRFQNFVQYGGKHVDDKEKIDYFAVSLPDLMIWDDDLNTRNQLHCKYLMALGNLGMGHTEKARGLFQEILEKDRYHGGAFVHLNMIKLLPEIIIR